MREPKTKEVFVCGDCFAMLEANDGKRKWTPDGVRSMQLGEVCAFHMAAGAIPVAGASTWVLLKEGEDRRYVHALSAALAKRGPNAGAIDPEDQHLVAKLALQILIAEESYYNPAAVDGAVMVASRIVRHVKGPR